METAEPRRSISYMSDDRNDRGSERGGEFGKALQEGQRGITVSPVSAAPINIADHVSGLPAPAPSQPEPSQPAAPPAASDE